MLAFTSRVVDTTITGASAFTTRHRPWLDALSSAEVTPGPGGGWRLDTIAPDLADAQVVQKLAPLLRGDAPVLVHVHGCFNPPATCFERGRLLEAIYGVRVVLFSWPSEGLLPDGSDDGAPPDASDDEGSLVALQASDNGGTAGKNTKSGKKNKGGIAGIARRYHQARDNAQAAAPALARLLRLVAATHAEAKGQPFSVSAHSLGCELMQHTVAQGGALAALAAAHNVVLIAACASAKGHKAWVSQLRSKGKVFVTHNHEDTVLWGARVADGDDIKLGGELDDDRVAADGLCYVDFTAYGTKSPFAHTYFALEKMPKESKKLFRRLLASEADVQDGEEPGDVYLDCSDDRRACWMGVGKPLVGPG